MQVKIVQLDINILFSKTAGTLYSKNLDVLKMEFELFL